MPRMAALPPAVTTRHGPDLDFLPLLAALPMAEASARLMAVLQQLVRPSARLGETPPMAVLP
jgi:hypothetical protein